MPSRLDEPVPYEVTELGSIYIEQQSRTCTTCGVVGFLSGYIWGDDLYCDEHEPELFMRDFRRIEREYKEDGTMPDYECCWTQFDTVTEIDGELVLVLWDK